jgi:hypothetical protein
MAFNKSWNSYFTELLQVRMIEGMRVSNFDRSPNIRTAKQIRHD